MHVPHALRILSAGALLALIATLAVGGARAAQNIHPAEPAASIASLRALVDHYRAVTWRYQAAAKLHRTPTSYSYRRSSDRAYLRWTIDRWTRLAYVARERTLTRIHRRLAVKLPPAPGLRSSLRRRVAYSRVLTLKLRKIYPGTVTRSFASARASSADATLRLWQVRSAAAALDVAVHAQPRPDTGIPDRLRQAFLCIHSYEGAWTSNTGNGYYGGLQMDWGFMRTYGPEFVRQWGSADNWPVDAQLVAAARAHASGRGFTPWPNTARACGLL
jgi:Transglycosylase-like domain